MKSIKVKFNSFTLAFILFTFLCGYIKNTLVVLFIVLFHELGHVIACLLMGLKVKEIEIYPFGGITKIDKLLNDDIYKDLIIAISGVLFQGLIFLMCKIGVIQSPLVFEYNLSIMLFNLLPIIPLDGSKIVFETLNMFLPYKRSLLFYPIISFIFIIIYFILNVHFFLNNYLIIILFLIKTLEIIKLRSIIHSKFVLERYFYDIDYKKVKNTDISDPLFYKDVKNYYKTKEKLIDEKEYLKKKFAK